MTEVSSANANDNRSIDDRLAASVESLRRGVAGEPDADVDDAVSDAIADWDEAWSCDVRTERLEIAFPLALS